MSGYYILRQPGRTAVRIKDAQTWARWWEAHGTWERQVALDTLPDGPTSADVLVVSTVFVGLDLDARNHIRVMAGKRAIRPLIFETMVFAEELKGGRPPCDLETARYSTWAQAEAGHARMVRKWRRHPRMSKR